MKMLYEVEERKEEEKKMYQNLSIKRQFDDELVSVILIRFDTIHMQMFVLCLTKFQYA